MRPRASRKAIQASRAHLTRAGYFATPDSATPSPRTSVSPASAPREVNMARMASTTPRASGSGRPVSSSASMDALAIEIEQPRAS